MPSFSSKVTVARDFRERRVPYEDTERSHPLSLQFTAVDHDQDQPPPPTEQLRGCPAGTRVDTSSPPASRTSWVACSDNACVSQVSVNLEMPSEAQLARLWSNWCDDIHSKDNTSITSLATTKRCARRSGTSSTISCASLVCFSVKCDMREPATKHSVDSERSGNRGTRQVAVPSVDSPLQATGTNPKVCGQESHQEHCTRDRNHTIDNTVQISSILESSTLPTVASFAPARRSEFRKSFCGSDKSGCDRSPEEL